LPENNLQREIFIKKLDEVKLWDFIIIGGGATGLGIAVDASSRGYSVLLLEQSDFAKGTSSRSTKLIHGGVRYLAQGNIQLVHEALRERGILFKNAPHLVKAQSFIIPCYSFFQKIKYWIGLKLYDWLSGRLSLGKSISLDKKQTIEHLPNIKQQGLIGGIEYYDGQFDDARLAINLAQTASEYGAAVLNYFKVASLVKNGDKISGVTAVDAINNKTYSLNAKAVINATGVFVDDILQLDETLQKKLVRASQGVHLVIDRSFLKSNDAFLIPKTSDGRVLFIVPWHQHVLLGTTDTPVDKILIEPVALDEEIEFILQTANQYLIKPPHRQDVLSVFVGLRPLAATSNANSTKEISRGHKLIVSDSGLITITGGKWTTYRKMAEDVIDKAMNVAGVERRKSKTREIKIHGYKEGAISVYGSDEEKIKELIHRHPSLDKFLNEKFPYKEAHVVWAVRNEMALTVEDVLARRTRILFLNAKVAVELTPRVALLMAKELNRDEEWIQSQINGFAQLAQQYLVNSI
jgi:glycerol-3-phosphate dehydrogenase